MRGTFGTLDARQMERMRLALIDTLCTHFASPPFFDPRAGAERVRPLERATFDAIAHFVHSVNYSALDNMDVSSHEVRRFFEGLLLRYLDVNPVFKRQRFVRYLPALRARAPRLAADVHRGLLASLDGKAPGFGAPPAKRSWIEGRERARRISKEDYERSTRILEAAMIRSRIDDYSDTGFVPQAEPADVARRPAATPAAPVASPVPARPAPDDDQWLNSSSADLTVPVSTTGFAAAYNALGNTAMNAQPTAPLPPLPPPPPPPPPQRLANEEPTRPLPVVSPPPQSSATAPRELPADLYELYGDFLQDMQPDTIVRSAAPARPLPPPPPPPPPPSTMPNQPTGPRFGASATPAAPWQTPLGAPPVPPMPSVTKVPPGPPPHSYPQGSNPNPSTHADQMVFWQLRYQLEAYVRRAAESYGLSYNKSDPSTVLDALRQSGFVDEADLRIAEGILALTDRVTRAPTVTTEDYRQAFLLYLLYHRSHLGI
ncbi:MAG TPA: hypothetical protein VFU63_09250 [Ktedonobacterales bacterium]|nr:hypothetical protein [Ktedonobacterales bacterium]